eukprot:394809-Rhodomonas_salina.4
MSRSRSLSLSLSLCRCGGWEQAYGCVLVLRDKVGHWAAQSGGFMPVSPQRETRTDDPRRYVLYSQVPGPLISCLCDAYSRRASRYCVCRNGVGHSS